MITNIYRRFCLLFWKFFPSVFQLILFQLYQIFKEAASYQPNRLNDDIGIFLDPYWQGSKKSHVCSIWSDNLYNIIWSLKNFHRFQSYPIFLRTLSSGPQKKLNTMRKRQENRTWIEMTCFKKCSLSENFVLPLKTYEIK